MKKWLFWLTLISAPLAASDECCFSSCECCSIDYSGQFYVKHREPGGIGYPRGYTTIGLFYTGSPCGPSYTFLDMRGHIDNDGKWASNFGIGTRKMSPYSDLVTGYNIYWDWRNAKVGSYHKLGVGFEALWPYWDVRFNGYIPIGNERESTRKGFDRFEGHHAYMFKKYILNMGGFDASVGYWLFKCGCVDMHASLGGYYFRGNFDAEFGGGIAKAKLKFWDWIELEGQVSYDNKFKWIGQGELGIYIPFGPTLKRYPRKTGCCADLIALEERLLERPDRFEVSVLASHKRTDKARHPRTERPLTFYFVDNTSSSNGSFESPFPTIGQAEAASGIGDAIYVFPGTQGYDESVALKDNQLLGGSGAPFEVQTRFGHLAIPQLTGTKPQIVGSGNQVVLANGNRISGMGFSLTGATNVIEGATIRNFSLKDNAIFATGTIVNGVGITGSFSGAFLAENNHIVLDGTRVAGLGLADFSGSLLAQSNTIDVTGATAASAVQYQSSNTGSTTLLNNRFVVQSESVANPVEVAFEMTGTLLAKDNLFFGRGENSAIGIIIGEAFHGRFITQNNTFDLEATNGSTGIRIFGETTGMFVASDNRFFVESTGPSQGISIGNSFTGDFSAQNNAFEIRGNTVRGIIFSPGTFSGSLLATENHMTLESSNASGISTPTIFKGSLSAIHNTIEAPSATIGAGFDFGGALSGQFIIEENVVSHANGALAIVDGLSNGALLLRNNTFTQASSAIAPTFFLLEDQADVIVENNLFSLAVDPEPAFAINAPSGTSHVQFAGNTIQQPTAPTAVFEATLGGTLELESPNLDVSGVEAINEGIIFEMDVTFVPFE